MDCESARAAISALLDGEPSGAAPGELDDHLARCAGCRRWRDGAHAVTRRVRLASARSAPPPGPELLAAIADSASGRRPGVLALARVALVAVALAQVVWVTVPPLLLGSDRGAPVHLAHEMGSFDLALAAGFLFAAWQPARAWGMRELVGVAALMLMLTAIVDLAGGRTTFADEAPHLLAVAGWLLLWRIAASDPSRRTERRASLPAIARVRALMGRAEAPAAGDALPLVRAEPLGVDCTTVDQRDVAALEADLHRDRVRAKTASG